MALEDLLRAEQLPWFGAAGQDSDVVLSSRVRLARNLVRLPFPGRADDAQLAEIQRILDNVLADLGTAFGQTFERIVIDELSDVQREVLIGKQLISEKFTADQPHRMAYISADMGIGILVNEDDHLHIQAMTPGLSPAEAFQTAARADDFIEARLDLAFDERMGYLTAQPTNLGTGLRASVIVHLPGLVYTRNIENIIHSFPQLGLAVQPLHGGAEGVHLYKISNQLTLGYAEAEIIENLRTAVGEIAAHERRARKALSYVGKDSVEDGVWRALGILSYARSLTEQETLDLLSRVRYGIDRGIITGVSGDCYGEIAVAVHDAYIRYMAGNEEYTAGEIAGMRAARVRAILDKYRTQG